MNVAVSHAFDIKLVYNGAETEPDGNVQVTFALKERKEEAVSVDVYHINDEATEVLETFR